ncbi:MAG: hypothetical protein ACJAZP_002599 [Psychromonas sp.]|jgi:hypothetical protein|uniref:hypothetical protein n=1 Tax=Psychromonas sp. TaxID=1884585 RepID=UPI0039E2A274
MPIKKQYLKSKPVVKVTFEIEKEEALGAKSIVLLSEHNNWSAIELKKFKNGKFKVTENIPTDGKEGYQFIYIATADQGNEFTILPSGADALVDNGMNNGDKNALLEITQ